jgi:hypothetical protein
MGGLPSSLEVTQDAEGIDDLAVLGVLYDSAAFVVSTILGSDVLIADEDKTVSNINRVRIEVGCSAMSKYVHSVAGADDNAGLYSALAREYKAAAS